MSVDYQKAYRLKHREKMLEYGRAYYAAHREEMREYQKRHRRENQASLRARNRELKHGLTVEAFAAQLLEQNSACAICLEPFTETPQVDHNHECCGEVYACDKCRRGLLCKHCNRGIGCLKDSPEIIQRALAYLVKHSSEKRTT
jgi:hypothetical protein